MLEAAFYHWSIKPHFKWACKRLRDHPRRRLEHLEQKNLFEVYINSRIRRHTCNSSSCSFSFPNKKPDPFLNPSGDQNIFSTTSIVIIGFAIMAPSATETTTTVVENIKSALKPSAQEENGKNNGQSVETDELPKLEVNHREPLKLSGALDQFKAFDVTPVIGREFIDVDLAAWLRAPNSDELIRDLGITSTSHFLPIWILLCISAPVVGLGYEPPGNLKTDLVPSLSQSRRGALSSSGSRTTSPMISRRSSCSV